MAANVQSDTAVPEPSGAQVAVLMSTFNGANFVIEQLASILSQLPPGGRVLIRDDGSSDGTADVIASLEDPRIELLIGSNLGFAASFLTLLGEASEKFDVFFFADQDDVWLPGKMQRALAAISSRPSTVPVLYCSRQTLVDSDLRFISHSQRFTHAPSFRNALCENIVTGCTAALNRSAALAVARTGNLEDIYFHDWWAYLVVSALGCVIFDDESRILYRQHARNVVGRGAGAQQYLQTLAFMLKRSWAHILFRQARNFGLVYGSDLPPEKRRELEQFLDPGRATRLARLLLSPVRRRHSWVDELLFRGVLLAEILSGRGLLPAPR
ncbi:glycosyltransferase family 2 protein [Ramlibacter rhizophilus]|uniref:Glycosyltransferase family 2 protein n=1 Tax=Ramlibacter rhizophilus TaxID=1781167 RepID=A0A4Z0BI05_9BURK|nr:glycosyltransferase family 2 protein [Ramlibacter rhizophilus]TFY97897.1 glycosyltransferase family 2 protein [Ramlibacter rhizophilus]